MKILFLVSNYSKEFKIVDFSNVLRLINICLKDKLDLAVTSCENIIYKSNKVYIKDGFKSENKKLIKIQNEEIINPVFIANFINTNKSDLEQTPQNKHIFDAIDIKGLNKKDEKKVGIFYMQYLIKNYWPKTRLPSNASMIKTGKWNLELYYKRAEDLGCKVTRPKTLLIEKEDLGKHFIKYFNNHPKETWLFKPHIATRCEDIFIANKKNINSVLKQINKSEYNDFIAQKYIINSAKYKNRVVDMRIYTAVYNWDPLDIKVFKGGFVRVSNNEFNIKKVTDINVATSTYSLLNSKLEHNLTILEYLKSITKDDKKLWRKIEEEIQVSIEALIKGSKKLEEDRDLNNALYLFGFDVMIEEVNGELIPNIIEMNHTPTLFRSKENDPDNKANKEVEKTYSNFFKTIIKKSKKENERLVNLKYISDSFIYREDFNYYLRETVARMLVEASNNLPEGYQFQLIEAYRTKKRQEKFIKLYTKKFKEKYPKLNQEQLMEKVYKYVKPSKGEEKSGHLTGAAIDLTLYKDGKPVKMNDDSLSFEENTKLLSPKLSLEIKKERHILKEAMEKAGFVNYPCEYWHWSYGDKLWSKYRDRSREFYK